MIAASRREPKSEPRMKVAPTQTAEENYASVANDLQHEANCDIEALRKEVASLWWKAEAVCRLVQRCTSGGPAELSDLDVSAERLEMAEAACEIGIRLNELGAKIGLMYDNLEAAMREGGAS